MRLKAGSISRDEGLELLETILIELLFDERIVGRRKGWTSSARRVSRRTSWCPSASPTSFDATASPTSS
jgi:hypothetical protein